MNWNILEVIGKFHAFLDYNYNLGGWHRVAIVVGWGLVIYAIVVTLMWRDEHRKKGDDQMG